MAEDVLFGWTARRRGARSAFAAGALAHHAVFERGPLAYIDERRRLLHFPAMASKTPELRGHFFYRRLFLSRRTAAFDLGAVGALLALVLRSPVPLVAAAPYVLLLRRRRLAAPVDAAADAVGLASLLRGSIRYRSPLV